MNNKENIRLESDMQPLKKAPSFNSNVKSLNILIIDTNKNDQDLMGMNIINTFYDLKERNILESLGIGYETVSFKYVDGTIDNPKYQGNKFYDETKLFSKIDNMLQEENRPSVDTAILFNQILTESDRDNLMKGNIDAKSLAKYLNLRYKSRVKMYAIDEFDKSVFYFLHGDEVFYITGDVSYYEKKITKEDLINGDSFEITKMIYYLYNGYALDELSKRDIIGESKIK